MWVAKEVRSGRRQEMSKGVRGYLKRQRGEAKKKIEEEDKQWGSKEWGMWGDKLRGGVKVTIGRYGQADMAIRTVKCQIIQWIQSLSHTTAGHCKVGNLGRWSCEAHCPYLVYGCLFLNAVTNAKRFLWLVHYDWSAWVSLVMPWHSVKTVSSKKWSYY